MRLQRMRKRIAVLLLMAASTTSGQVVDTTVTIDGKKVGMQKLTIDCVSQRWRRDEGPANVISPVNVTPDRLHKTIKREYTLHLLDLTALSADRRRDVRPEANGWYSWTHSEWSEFVSIDENEIVLFKEGDDDWFTAATMCDTAECPLTKGVQLKNRNTATYAIEARIDVRAEQGKLNRNTLQYTIDSDIVCTYATWQEARAKVDSGWGPAVCSQGPFKRIDFSKLYLPPGQCNVIAYRAPPKRLGF
jgi:hypothetical protein